MDATALNGDLEAASGVDLRIDAPGANARAADPRLAADPGSAASGVDLRIDAPGANARAADPRLAAGPETAPSTGATAHSGDPRPESLGGTGSPDSGTPRDDVLHTTDEPDSAPPGGDLRITVEPGIPRPRGDQDQPGERPAAAPGACPHRVRVRDLTPGGRVLYMTGLAAVTTAAITQLLALFLGGFLLSIGAEIGGLVPVATGGLLVLGTMLGMIGVFALVGTWRRLHRPEAPIPWLTAAGTLLTLTAAVLIGLWVEVPSLAVLALPTAAITAHLLHLRTALAPRDNCDTDPNLPPRARTWLARP
ncbi:hypothetical protein [Glycomyces terrestris]|uniref:Uncharacterized protein n=1 Tax=Glycomyces terrestris TaxID=2493553 RepID=A0A426UXP3_9ACTN|nr:hypothetical protein [Glycomyces terrestris]RRR99280.1 hypothetical protein EIW28_11165 [Glycomyces terrestris]